MAENKTSSSNYTGLYGATNVTPTTASGDLVVPGNLAVNGGTITTTAPTGNLFPTTDNVNIGSATGEVNIGNNLCIEGNTLQLNCGISTGANAYIVVDRGSSGDAGILEWNESATRFQTNYGINAPGATLGNINIAPGSSDNTISTTSGDLYLEPTTGVIGVLPSTLIEWNENNTRTNRLNFKSTTGNTSGIRVVAPNTTSSANAIMSVYGSSDINNGLFTNFRAFGVGATDPLRIQTGKYTAGVLGPSGTSFAFFDNVTKFASINPAGPTDPLDLTTKDYVDTAIINGSGNYQTVLSGSGTLNLNAPNSGSFIKGYSLVYLPALSTMRPGQKFNFQNTNTGGLDIHTSGTDKINTAATVGNLVSVITIKSQATIEITAGDSLTNWYISNGTGALSINSQTFINNLDVTGTTSLENTLSVFGANDGATTVYADEINIGRSTRAAGGTPHLNFISASGTHSLHGYNAQIIASGGTTTNGSGTLTVNANTFAVNANSNAWSFNNDGTTQFPNYKFPSADGSANQVLKTNGAGVLAWYTPSDLNTTYTYTASSATGGANLTLTGSDASVNTVKVTSGTGITVADVSSTEISITNAGVTSAVAGTGISVSGATGAVTINNTGVLSVTGGGHITATTVSGAVTLGSDATDANTAGTIVARDGSGNFSAGTVTLAGDLAVNGSDITTTSTGTATVFNTNATTLNIGGAATAVNIGASTGTTTVNNALAVTGSATTGDMSRVLGQLYASRNATWTPPPNALTSLAGNNGVAIGSSNPGSGNGYSPQVQLVYCSGDTTAGTNASAAIVTRGSAGTTASPSAIATNQVAGTWNIDGYATSGWASAIATTGSGAGTTSINPLQVQAYAVSAFTDSAGTVTNAPMGFRVRGFASSTNLSAANRFNFMDLTAATQTYKTTTFNVQPTTTTANYLTLGATTGSINQDTFTLKNNASTTTYATFASTGATIGGVDGATSITRVRGASAGTSPSLILRNSNTVAAAPATGDGTTFRMSTAGSNATNYTIAEIGATYSTTGDDSVTINLASGDQTTGTLTSVQTFNTKVSSTTIRAGTASATPGASTVSDVATFTTANTTIKSDAVTLQTNAGVALVGSKVSYNRVYGQWQYDATITPVAANTAYAYPIANGVTDFANIATVGSTSRIIPGAAGLYKLQFSVQINNADNGSDHVAYFWWRKNGVDVAGSTGQVAVTKGNATIAGWDNMISSANTTDYWELMYAVDNTQLTLPYYAATAFCPAAASMFITLVPVGA